MKHLVTGAGGFIGGHLVQSLLERGDEVRAVDVKPRDEWWQIAETERVETDLREQRHCAVAMHGIDQVWNLATDMGGIGYLSAHKLEPMRSVLINTYLLNEAARQGVQRYLFTSSACVYGEGTDTREETAYPADCEDGYGWEKLFSERMCRHYTEERGLATRVVRLHNVYGPQGSWNDGREKAPAALCRKVAEAIAEEKGSIEIWGDGKQQRSFLYISDCLEGLGIIMDGEHSEPVNLGSEEMVSIAQLARKVEKIAGVTLNHRHDSGAPRGVKGRTSQNDLLWRRYEWEPEIALDQGLAYTYAWVAEQVAGKVAA